MVALSLVQGIGKDGLEAIYSDPYITKVGHDHRPAAPVTHPLATYLTAMVGGRFAGAFLVIRFSPIEFELHSLLHKWAVRQSRALCRLAIGWCFDRGALRVTAHVIDGLQTAYNFCLRLGFQHEGTRRNACVVGGEPRDVHTLGLLRSEWEGSR